MEHEWMTHDLSDRDWTALWALAAARFETRRAAVERGEAGYGLSLNRCLQLALVDLLQLKNELDNGEAQQPAKFGPFEYKLVHDFGEELLTPSGAEDGGEPEAEPTFELQFKSRRMEE